MIEAQRPDKFNADFLENVLKLKGGAARATIPILKKMGFLASDSTPTDRSEYAHSVDDAKLKDIIVEITGLKPNDQVAAAIRFTFNVIKSHVPANINTSSSTGEVQQSDEGAPQKPPLPPLPPGTHDTKTGIFDWPTI